jgi:hypothetical protein
MKISFLPLFLTLCVLARCTAQHDAGIHAALESIDAAEARADEVGIARASNVSAATGFSHIETLLDRRAPRWMRN